jgi:nucleotide-binding universal stress UspA family protein
MSPESEQPVLFAYDGSDHAKAAIEQAGGLLRQGSSALVLTVWQPLGSVPFFGGVMSPSISKEVVDAARAEAERIAAEGAQLANANGFDAKPIVAEGTPIWNCIIETAEQRQAAVLVIGSHGRSGLSYAAMGSVATSVAHHVKRPVLVTRLA